MQRADLPARTSRLVAVDEASMITAVMASEKLFIEDWKECKRIELRMPCGLFAVASSMVFRAY